MKQIEIISRAIIIRGHKTLLCRGKGNSWYYFPGGHVEFGETVEEALIRELKEEAGVNLEIIKPIGIVENVFLQKNKKRHEINFVFLANVEKLHIESQENNLEFEWKNLRDTKVLPGSLKKAILRWPFPNK